MKSMPINKYYKLVQVHINSDSDSMEKNEGAMFKNQGRSGSLLGKYCNDVSISNAPTTKNGTYLTNSS